MFEINVISELEGITEDIRFGSVHSFVLPFRKL